jgi:hypothetical protein
MSQTVARRLILVAPLALFAACNPDSRNLPSAPIITAQQTAAAQAHTKTFPNVDGSFGPAVLASCDEGYDLVFQFKGTVTIIETIDPAGNITKLRNVWNLTVYISNSVTGYTVFGPSYGPDQTTFNSDGTSRLVQYGLLLHLKLPDGTQLLDAGTVEFFFDQNGGITLVAMHGPHPDHEGFPERPVLCGLLNH